MAEQQVEEKGVKRKCAQTGVPLKKTRQYYREGAYFVNKKAFQAWKKIRLEKNAEEKAKKEAEAQQPKAEEPKAA